MIFELLKKIGLTNEQSSIIRRGLAMAVFAGVSAFVAEAANIAPEYMIPIVTAILAMIDKASRTFK